MPPDESGSTRLRFEASEGPDGRSVVHAEGRAADGTEFDVGPDGDRQEILSTDTRPPEVSRGDATVKDGAVASFGATALGVPDPPTCKGVAIRDDDANAVVGVGRNLLDAADAANWLAAGADDPTVHLVAPADGPSLDLDAFDREADGRTLVAEGERVDVTLTEYGLTTDAGAERGSGEEFGL